MIRYSREKQRNREFERAYFSAPISSGKNVKDDMYIIDHFVQDNDV